jgi:hypothetical protein
MEGRFRNRDGGDIHAAQFMSASGLLSDIDAWPADVAD